MGPPAGAPAYGSRGTMPPQAQRPAAPPAYAGARPPTAQGQPRRQFVGQRRLTPQQQEEERRRRAAQAQAEAAARSRRPA